MTVLSSILYIILCLPLWQTSSSLQEEDFEDSLTPSLDNHVYLHREVRAASDDLSYYESDFEISFSDPTLEAEIRRSLENLDIYTPLLNTTTVIHVDLSPVCSLNESHANCSCPKDYNCLGTLGPCTDTSCICITDLPLQKYCISETGTIPLISPSTHFQGDTVTIDCLFRERGNISWYHNSVKIPNVQKYNTSSNWQGTMVLYTLTMNDLTDSDQGNYTCSLNSNGTMQAKSIILDDIKTLQISPSDNRDSFSDGSEFNLTCCSPYTGEFNVTWTTIGPAGGTGNTTSNTTCSIYSVTPSAMEFLSLVTSYTCSFQRNKGATISKTIKVTYYKKANITIPSSLKISTRKNLMVNCKTNMNVTKILWMKDSNVVANSGILQKDGVTPYWAGTYLCVVYQGNLTSYANLTVIIIPLPLTEEITVYPLQTYLTCENTAPVEITCCVNDNGYTRNFTFGSTYIRDANPNCSSSNINFDCNTKTPVSVSCVVFNSQNDNVTSKEMTISYVQVTAGQQNCKAEFGLSETPSGKTNAVLCQKIDPTMLGYKTFICNDGSWSVLNDDCYSAKISQELENVKDVINGPEVRKVFPKLLENITGIANSEKKNIQNSSKTLELMVKIISILAKTEIPVNQPMMQNIITTVDIMVDKPSVWNRVANQSVTLLKDVDTFSKNLNFNGNISFQNKSKNNNIQLFGQTIENATDYNGGFSLLNLTGDVFIDKNKWPGNASKVITVTYGTIKDILAKPVNTKKVVNGLVMSTITDLNSTNIDNSTFKIKMSFSKSNTSLGNPECVWYDSVRDVWDSSGCDTTEEKGLIVCSCNHLTSFSILMGPVENTFLDIISYIGVGISLACLVVTLLIEALVWASVIKNKTSYIRHVCLVNIAVTLLVADIWFIIGASLVNNNKGSAACKAAAFFSFFFYLSLFFWMLTTGLILFYRMIYVLHDMSRKTMMIIAFLLGYGCPLLITIITVASTEPRGTFTSSNLCWLDYDSKTFLAFVVPALSIVFINILILIVVIFKLMRPTVGEKPGREDRKTVIVIAKTMAVLNPLLGTTWGFGLGLIFDPTNLVIHGIFAALNSFQGLFILISTVLLDQKVRKAVRSSISSSYWRTIRSRVQTTSTDSSEQSRSRSKPRKNHARKKFYGKKAAYDLFAAADSSETTGSSYSALP